MKLISRISLAAFSLLTACASLSTSPESDQLAPKADIEARTAPIAISSRATGDRSLRKKMDKFRSILRNLRPGQSLSPQSWKLHDELLTEYEALKTAVPEGSRITVPAHSRLTVELPSFCLNPSAGAPSRKERFQWIKGDPEIPYFRELMRSMPSHPEWPQDRIQELVWNL